MKIKQKRRTVHQINMQTTAILTVISADYVRFQEIYERILESVNKMEKILGRVCVIINLFILGNEGRKVWGVSIFSTVKLLMRLSQKLNFGVNLRGSQRTALNRTEEHPLFRRPHVASSRGFHEFRSR